MDSVHLSPTCTANHNDQLYVLKLDTRIEGPWTDKDPGAPYIPRQFRGFDATNFYPLQTKVWNSADVVDNRSINYVCNPGGCVGKTVIAALMALHQRAVLIPPVNDAEKLIASICNILSGREIREPKCMFIDLPRSLDKAKLGGIYSAIEQIKNGYVYDMRYHYKEWWFDSPQLWIFSNEPPKLHFLSRDRWNLWQVVDNDLVPYEPDEPVG